MINLNIQSSADNSNGLKKGTHYFPIMTFKDNRQIGLIKQSDGVTDSRGYLYPQNINDNYNLGSIQSYFNGKVYLPMGALGLDDQNVTAGTKKTIVGDQWFGRYDLLISARLPCAKKWRQTVIDNYTSPNWINSDSYPAKILEIDPNTCVLFFKKYNAGLEAIVIQRNATTNVITVGTPVDVYTTNTQYNINNTDAVLIDTNKFIVAYPQSGEVKCGLISGTTITFGTGVAINPSYGAYTLSLTKVDVGKAALAYKNNQNNIYVCAMTVPSGSSVAITKGSDAGVITNSNGNDNPWITANTTTECFVTWKDGATSKTRGVIISVSGTSCTVNTPADITTSAYCTDKALYFGKIGTNKIMMLTRENRLAWVITVSGTTFTSASSPIANAFYSSYNYYGGNFEITTSTEYHMFENDGTTTQVRRFLVSGTTVTDTVPEILTNDADPLTYAGQRRYIGYAIVSRLGSDFILISLATNSYYDYMSAYICPTQPTSFDIYIDTTNVATVTQTHPLSTKLLPIGAAVGNKKLYFGIKNTGASDRAVMIEELSLNVR